MKAVMDARGKAEDIFDAIKREAKANPDKTIGDFLTCQHCGHTGLDVIEKRVRVYSKLHEVRSYCQDIDACWARYDRANLFPGWSLERN